MLSRAVFRSTDSYLEAFHASSHLYYRYWISYTTITQKTIDILLWPTHPQQCPLKRGRISNPGRLHQALQRASVVGQATLVDVNQLDEETAITHSTFHTHTQTLLSIRYDPTSALRAASKLPCNDFHPCELMSEINGANRTDKLTKCFNQARIVNSTRMDFKMYK